jgi:membrane protein
MITNMFAKILRWCVHFIKYFYQEFQHLHVSQHASAMTLTSLLSIVPLFALSLTIMSILPQAESNQTMMQDYVFSHFVPESGQVITQWLEQFVEQARQLSWVGIAFFFVTAIILLNNIELTFNKIWYVKHKRPFLLKLLIYWTFITAGPLILAAAVLLGSELDWSQLPITQLTSSGGTLAFLLIWFFFILLYFFVPQFPVSWLEATFGALLVTLILTGLKSLLGSWLIWFPSYQITYGAFAVIPLLLLWLYSSWLVIIAGALIVRMSSELHALHDRKNQGDLAGVIAVLQWLSAHSLTNQRVSDRDFRRFPNISLVTWRTYMNWLEHQGWVARDDNGDFILSTDKKNITLGVIMASWPWPKNEHQWQALPHGVRTELQLLGRKQQHILDTSIFVYLKTEKEDEHAG